MLPHFSSEQQPKSRGKRSEASKPPPQPQKNKTVRWKMWGAGPWLPVGFTSTTRGSGGGGLWWVVTAVVGRICRRDWWHQWTRDMINAVTESLRTQDEALGPDSRLGHEENNDRLVFSFVPCSCELMIQFGRRRKKFWEAELQLVLHSKPLNISFSQTLVHNSFYSRVDRVGGVMTPMTFPGRSASWSQNKGPRPISWPELQITE